MTGRSSKDDSQPIKVIKNGLSDWWKWVAIFALAVVGNQFLPILSGQTRVDTELEFIKLQIAANSASIDKLNSKVESRLNTLQSQITNESRLTREAFLSAVKDHDRSDAHGWARAEILLWQSWKEAHEKQHSSEKGQ